MRGAADHVEIVTNHPAPGGLNRVALDTGADVADGINTVDTTERPLERAGCRAGEEGCRRR